MLYLLYYIKKQFALNNLKKMLNPSKIVYLYKFPRYFSGSSVRPDNRSAAPGRRGEIGG